ncbi:MAG: hypothetical protein ACRDJN_12635 [Chloroflexota bacterium]
MNSRHTVNSRQQCSERHDDVAEAVELAGFSSEDRERLLRLRRQVARGERSDRLPIDKRQDFVRWLVEQGRLSDN